jgi:hypothetical protein
MPYKWETNKIKLPSGFDRRIKLNNAQREDIKERHKQGQAIRAIARKYPQVSRRTIQMIIYPERYKDALEKAKQWRKENGNIMQRVGKKRWAKIQKEYRQYKQSVLKGRITNQ